MNRETLLINSQNVELRLDPVLPVSDQAQRETDVVDCMGVLRVLERLKETRTLLSMASIQKNP
jgi:hypothetical protein